MRFKTEFKFDPIVAKNHTDVNRDDCELKLGKMISETFGWQRKSEITQDGILERSTLEIEAFPMDKWVEFKQFLFTELSKTIINSADILNRIKDLEFYSNNKKQVDEIVNQQLNK